MKSHSRCGAGQGTISMSLQKLGKVLKWSAIPPKKAETHSDLSDALGLLPLSSPNFRRRPSWSQHFSTFIPGGPNLTWTPPPQEAENITAWQIRPRLLSKHGGVAAFQEVHNSMKVAVKEFQGDNSNQSFLWLLIKFPSCSCWKSEQRRHNTMSIRRIVKGSSEEQEQELMCPSGCRL